MISELLNNIYMCEKNEYKNIYMCEKNEYDNFCIIDDVVDIANINGTQNLFYDE